MWTRWQEGRGFWRSVVKLLANFLFSGARLSQYPSHPLTPALVVPGEPGQAASLWHSSKQGARAVCEGLKMVFQWIEELLPYMIHQDTTYKPQHASILILFHNHATDGDLGILQDQPDSATRPNRPDKTSRYRHSRHACWHHP